MTITHVGTWNETEVAEAERILRERLGSRYAPALDGARPGYVNTCKIGSSCWFEVEEWTVAPDSVLAKYAHIGDMLVQTLQARGSTHITESIKLERIYDSGAKADIVCVTCTTCGHESEPLANKNDNKAPEATPGVSAPIEVACA